MKSTGGTTMSAFDTINYYYNKNDPKTSEMFLISRPGILFAILLFYHYICIWLGPKFMEKRSPFVLRKTLVIYNFVQILLSIYIAYEGLMAGWLFEYSYTCQPVDYSESPASVRMARITHVYFMCKLIELLDTIFFVLRKKQRQISFLHLYHHTAMPLLSWFGVRYFPNGHGTFFGLMNSFVHIVMYAYYMLAAVGPEMQKYLWWKKYLTLLQILQFTLVGIHSGQMIFNGCNYPIGVSLLIVIESIVFLYMFGSFYVKNHMKRAVCTASDSADSDSNSTSLKSD